MDNNVTRHVPDELRHSDWQAMVLHFLGLDHIGHKTGPKRYEFQALWKYLTIFSQHMFPKQVEMDDIVKLVYTAFQQEHHLQDALLVLVGDHGMNDAGNHGGSSAGETSAALVFISPKLEAIQTRLTSPAVEDEDFKYYVKVEQNDVVPSLAALLGFPIPRNSLGVMIPELLPLWPC